GSFSMAGLPPFNGFLSKEMFFTAALSVKELAIFSLETWGILFPIIAWIASVFTFVYSMIIVFKTFLGTYRGETIAKKDIEPPVGMLSYLKRFSERIEGKRLQKRILNLQ